MRLIGPASALVFALGSTQAISQQSTTTCRNVGSSVVCDTKERKDIWGEFAREVEADNARSQAEARDNRAARERSAITEVWARCRKRWNEAIEARDFPLADSLAKGCPATP